ncbi:hypothetical protein BBK82_38005 [Lentzea guizhouensis]|uniref:Uncharacterized protein n=1 Tax=Lentzea guizhouensis TaxID=1586287 RepID=A0A1B2HT89_9PSEU|nr:hypothetical protein [Lentzea guizhouensis]ANZ40922.1 hypothetical protein BBK82_38005 [Lentzea guizhouensis]
MANHDVAPSLSRELHHLLMMASISSLAQIISAELLCALAASGVWSPQRIVSHARRMRTPYDCAATLAVALPHLPPERQPEVLAEALSVVDTIDDDQYRIAVLIDLAPHLTGEQLEHVLAATLAVPEGTARVSALTKPAPHLSGEQRRTLPAAATLTDHEVADLFDGLPLGSDALSMLPEFTGTLAFAARISLTGELAANFPEPDRSRWLDTALAEIDDGDHGLDVKLELAPHLSATQVAELRSAVDSVEDEPHRLSLLARLVPFLPGDQRTATATLVKDALGTPDQWIDRAKVLPSLARYLSGEEVAEVFADTIRLAGVPDRHLRTTSPVVELAPHLPADLRALAVCTATRYPSGMSVSEHWSNWPRTSRLSATGGARCRPLSPLPPR